MSTFGRKEGPIDGPQASRVHDRPVSRALGLPTCLSWIQLLGMPMTASLPRHTVFCFHLHDVIPTDARADLPWIARLAYWPSRRHGDPLAHLDTLLGRMKANGTRFIQLWTPEDLAMPQPQGVPTQR